MYSHGEGVPEVLICSITHWFFHILVLIFIWPMRS